MPEVRKCRRSAVGGREGGCAPPGGECGCYGGLSPGRPAGPIPAVTDSITPGGDSIRLPAVTPSLLQL